MGCFGVAHAHLNAAVHLAQNLVKAAKKKYKKALSKFRDEVKTRYGLEFPSAPGSPYALFVKATYSDPKFKEGSTEHSLGSMSKRAAAMWNDLGDADRAKWSVRGRSADALPRLLADLCVLVPSDRLTFAPSKLNALGFEKPIQVGVWVGPAPGQCLLDSHVLLPTAKLDELEASGKITRHAGAKQAESNNVGATAQDVPMEAESNAAKAGSTGRVPSPLSAFGAWWYWVCVVCSWG